MSHYYAAVIFRCDKKPKARRIFQRLDSTRHLVLFRQENRVWSITVDHFDPDLDKASQLREVQSLARQVSRETGAALVEVYDSFIGLRQQYYVRHEVVFDNLQDGLEAVDLDGRRISEIDNVSDMRQFHPNEIVEKRFPHQRK